MSLPLFFIEHSVPPGSILTLSEETSKHVVQVLRMRQGEGLQLTDGKGNKWTSEILDDNKKKCTVTIKEHEYQTPRATKYSIGISLLKNASRFEWFLEKAVEIGIQEIVPLICDRTERQFFRTERMKNILTSAMLQSGQVWLTHLHNPIEYPKFITDWNERHHQFIAHCMDGEKKNLPDEIARINSESGNHDARIILIGPEGDFTSNEVEAAIAKKFIAVSLSSNRLRAETAGLVAATLISL